MVDAPPSNSEVVHTSPASVAATLGRRAKQRTTGKRRVSSLLTMTVVVGLFAVAALPAYAMNTVEDAASAPYSEAGAQSISVSASSNALASARDVFTATTPEQLAEQRAAALRQVEADARSASIAAYVASGAQAAGDDYPWPYAGEGLSPLNYYYGECVDFVAWRLNRDAGSTSAPFKWVWSTLTPYGGNASQWRSSWEAKGWPVSSTPVVGSVAVTGYNHVAYVKAVLDGGYVLLEEYNYGGYHQYGQRTVAASSVSAFLYPPG